MAVKTKEKSTKKKGETATDESEAPKVSKKNKSKGSVVSVSLDQIVMPPKSLIVRDSVGDTGELERSIRGSAGLINPLLVRPSKGGKFELLCGHRRFAALRNLKRKDVMVNVRADLADDADALGVIVAENSEDARTAMTPVEQARAFSAMAKKIGDDNKEIGKRCGFSAEHVRRMIRLLEAPKPLLDRLSEGEVSADLVINYQQIADKKTQKNVLAQIVDGTVKTKADLKQAQAEYIRSLSEDEEVEAPSDKRKQGGRGGAPTAYRTKSELKEIFDTLIVELIEATDGKDEAMVELRRAQLVVIMWYMGLVGDIDSSRKDFDRALKREVKRVQEEQAEEEEGEEGEEEEAEEVDEETSDEPEDEEADET